MIRQGEKVSAASAFAKSLRRVGHAITNLPVKIFAELAKKLDHCVLCGEPRHRAFGYIEGRMHMLAFMIRDVVIRAIWAPPRTIVEREIAGSTG